MRGVRPVKRMLFLMAARATTLDCEWVRIYHRLLPRLAIYDERIKELMSSHDTSSNSTPKNDLA